MMSSARQPEPSWPSKRTAKRAENRHEGCTISNCIWWSCSKMQSSSLSHSLSLVAIAGAPLSSKGGNECRLTIPSGETSLRAELAVAYRSLQRRETLIFRHGSMVACSILWYTQYYEHHLRMRTMTPTDPPNARLDLVVIGTIGSKWSSALQRMKSGLKALARTAPWWSVVVTPVALTYLPSKHTYHIK
jgi:hypothetical protein